MTDKESKLIERLMQGDMEAFDELMPNARPEDRANFEDAIKKAREIGGEQDPISRAWIVFVLYIIGKNMGDFRKYDREANQKIADGWDKAMSDAIKKYNNE